jgi:DNA-binding MarR family transcriptional regulator
MPSVRPKVARRQYETLAAFRQALREFLRFSQDAARAAGLTPQQHQALLAIKGFPGGTPISVGELAGRLQVRHHSAVGLVDRLVKARLLRRVPLRTDRRKVTLRLTAGGEKILRKLSAAHLSELRKLRPHLGPLLALP